MNRVKKIKPIMFVGTGSDVGKSVINAGFCRIFLQDGYKPAPFKAQNMSLNSYATPDGLEIGRAQAVQAEACELPCCVEMNPLLLKPVSYQSSQIVLNGKPIGNKTASEYFLETDREKLFKEVMRSYLKLDKAYNPVVIEGAGSISEINLKDKDITNMRVALFAKAAVYLVADIDRGGIFGSVYGTIELLPEEERKLIKGIIINKFRGDINLFKEGKKILEELTGVPVIGIVPYFKDIFIEQEDSVVLDNKKNYLADRKINIAVVLLKHMSNFTDFNMLEQIPEVNLFYAREGNELARADIILIPGSKNTIADLLHLKASGLAETIVQMHEKGKQIYGICGGYQIMGEEIRDPSHVEGDIEKISGLGILPVNTILTQDKKTEQCAFSFLGKKELCYGYEIHMGFTQSKINSPLCNIGSEGDGFYLNPRTFGTYIHGIFDNKLVIEYILKQVDRNINVELSYKEFKEENFNKLADFLRQSIDMELVYKHLNYD